MEQSRHFQTVKILIELYLEFEFLAVLDNSVVFTIFTFHETNNSTISGSVNLLAQLSESGFMGFWD
jgi:hypothetical protein